MNQETASYASLVFCGIYNKQLKHEQPKCPLCKKPYMGAGEKPCVECEKLAQQAGWTVKTV